MTTNLHGVYETANEARESIEQLKAQGTRSSAISIVLNDEEKGTFLAQETDTNIHVEGHRQQKKEKHGFMDNVKEALAGTPRENETEGHTKDTLIRLGLSEEDASLYIDDIQNGKIVVLMHTEDPYTNPATEPNPAENSESATLSHNATSSSSRGSTSANAEAENNSTHEKTGDTKSEEEQALQLREETLDVSKKNVDRGEVEVTKDVVEDEKTVSVPVQREEGYIEKRPVDSNDYESTEDITESSEHIRMPLTDEEVDIQKRTVVTDEVVVGKRKYEETQEQTEKVKREEARIEGEENLQREDKENDAPDDGSLNPLQNKRKDK